MTKLSAILSTGAAASLCAITGLALAQQTPPTTTETPPQTQHEQYGTGSETRTAMAEALTNESFVEKAAMSNMLEIQASELAAQKSQDPQIRDFSQRIVQDHQQAGDQLKSIAQQQNIEVPQQLDSKHQEKLQTLQTAPGDAFDDEYARIMVESHDKAVQLYQQASTSGQLDQSLQSFAEQTLPTLEQHNQMASDLRKGEMRSAEGPSEPEQMQR